MSTTPTPTPGIPVEQVHGHPLTAWRSHKVVQAAKILAVDLDKLTLSVIVNEDTDESLILDVKPYTPTFFVKHDPQVGGYYVRYPDGYESWSPADAFEDGYTRVE